ncbi:helix-turn-helix domain-containing protein [Sediminibacter sp. Hel_I_10]|uniref:helix-turn-helix domain-containing protein n=1 Tax=Sediminibacter sp. Hel_I_10 TaxID=1392490 RepID=UPI0005616EDC|nr:helix-turn-helix domain-containing protein [Sediminibacter sp. Hel_I_10]
METPKNGSCRKKQYQKISFDLKLSIIDEIANGQTSVNHAANKYNIPRSSIEYWIKKLSNFENKSNTMSKNQEIKKLKERIEELEFVKDFQQDVIADFENVTGEHLSKKYLPEALVKEIEKKRKDLTR